MTLVSIASRALLAIRKGLLFVALSSGVYSAFAQTGTISGSLVDSKTKEPIPFAHVFLGNTTKGTTSDVDGKFLLGDVPIGKSELIVSFVGYELYRAPVTIAEGQAVTVAISLVPAQNALDDVAVKGTRDKEWERQLKRFTKIFLGGDKIAAACKITNPWVIDFTESDNDDVFAAKASAPIEIENNALGYTIQFFLRNFQSSGQSYLIDGSAFFHAMSDSTKQALWLSNREKVYAGSERHLFKSILENKAHKEGFRLYYDIAGVPNINTRSDIFYSDLKKKVLEYDDAMVFPASSPHEYIIRLKGRTEIHYLYGETVRRLYKDVVGPVSWMEVNGNLVRVNGNGVVLNPSDMTLSGDMSYFRVSSILPLDYSPVSTKGTPTRRIPLVIEKAYVHTDKPYYYPGETIWMKGYLSTNREVPYDSLSRVLHVELINESKVVIKKLMLRMDSGRTRGALVLPVSLPAGNYLLRAYTQWMRNFGEPCFFIKPVTLLQQNETVLKATVQGTQSNDQVSITLNQHEYGTREKIQLSIHVRDSNAVPVRAHLSVSVTDMAQVVPVEEPLTIMEGLAIPNLPRPGRIFYHVEHGVYVSGDFEDEGRKKSASLMVLLGKFDDMLMVDTDAKGKFELNGLDFFDSTKLSLQALNKRGKPYGKVTLHQVQTLQISPWKRQDLTIADAGTAQRSLVGYEASGDAIELKEVTIKGTRMEKMPEEIQHRIAGKPDYTVNAEILTRSGTTNLAVALQGKVPGLTIITSFDNQGVHYILQMRGTNTILGTKEPLLLIDGTPMGGAGADGDSMGDTSGDRLAMIDINTIDRVEVTTRINSLYGLAGKNGVVAIYTKANAIGRFQETKGMDVFTIRGFDSPRTFRATTYDLGKGDESKQDDRSTIYWNPDVTTDKLTGTCYLSFFSSDLAGSYRIVVEGVTESGEPVRAESTITIRNE